MELVNLEERASHCGEVVTRRRKLSELNPFEKAYEEFFNPKEKHKSLIGINITKKSTTTMNQLDEALKAGLQYIQVPISGRISKAVLQTISRFFAKHNISKKMLVATSMPVPEDLDEPLAHLRQCMENFNGRKLDLFILENPVGHRNCNFRAIYESKTCPPVSSLFKRRADGTLLVTPKIVQDLFTLWQRLQEEAVEGGLVSSLGLCNFSWPQIRELLKVTKKGCIVIQTEIHPYSSENILVKRCKSSPKVQEIFSLHPFGNPNHKVRKKMQVLKKHRTVKKIARALCCDPKIVLLLHLRLQNISAVFDYSTIITPAYVLQNIRQVQMNEELLTSLSSMPQQNEFGVLSEFDLWQGRYPHWPFYFGKRAVSNTNKKSATEQGRSLQDEEKKLKWPDVLEIQHGKEKKTCKENKKVQELTKNGVNEIILNKIKELGKKGEKDSKTREDGRQDNIDHKGKEWKMGRSGSKDSVMRRKELRDKRIMRMEWKQRRERRALEKKEQHKSKNQTTNEKKDKSLMTSDVLKRVERINQLLKASDAVKRYREMENVNHKRSQSVDEGEGGAGKLKRDRLRDLYDKLSREERQSVGRKVVSGQKPRDVKRGDEFSFDRMGSGIIPRGEKYPEKMRKVQKRKQNPKIKRKVNAWNVTELQKEKDRSEIKEGKQEESMNKSKICNHDQNTMKRQADEAETLTNKCKISSEFERKAVNVARKRKPCKEPVKKEGNKITLTVRRTLAERKLKHDKRAHMLNEEWARHEHLHHEQFDTYHYRSHTSNFPDAFGFEKKYSIVKGDQYKSVADNLFLQDNHTKSSITKLLSDHELSCEDDCRAAKQALAQIRCQNKESLSKDYDKSSKQKGEGSEAAAQVMKQHYVEKEKQYFSPGEVGLAQALSQHVAQYMRKAYRKQIDEVFSAMTGHSDLYHYWAALLPRHQEVMYKTVVPVVQSRCAHYGSHGSDKLGIRETMRKDMESILKGKANPRYYGNLRERREKLATVLKSHIKAVLGRAAVQARADNLLKDHHQQQQQ